MSRLVALALLAAALAAAAAGAARLPSFAACRAQEPEVRPTDIVLACGDGNFFLSDLRWSRWDARGATGRGVAHWNDCSPTCVAGRFHAYAVAVALARPRTCPRGREFTEVRWVRAGSGVASSVERVGCV